MRDLKELKTDIRNQVSQLKSQMSAEDIQKRSDILTDLVLDLPEYKDTKVIFAYISANQEVRMDRLMAQARADGKLTAVPKTYPGKIMRFLYNDENTEFALKWQVMEPVDGEVADPYDICSKYSDCAHPILIIMPGLAFGRDLSRTGYGGGFYDRYLAGYADISDRMYTVGLCYDFQVFDEVPCEKTDKRIDKLLFA